MAITRKTILNSITLERLEFIARKLGLKNVSCGGKADMISLLESTRLATTEELLVYLRKDELQAACDAAGLTCIGRTKADFVTKLLNGREYKKSIEPSRLDTTIETVSHTKPDVPYPAKTGNITSKCVPSHHKPCPRCGTLKHPLNACHACGYSWYRERSKKDTKNRIVRLPEDVEPATPAETRNLLVALKREGNLHSNEYACPACKECFHSKDQLDKHANKMHMLPRSDSNISVVKFKKGDLIKHPSKPGWGTGEVLDDCTGNYVRIFFAGAGEKTLSLEFVSPIIIPSNTDTHTSQDSTKAAKDGLGYSSRHNPRTNNSFTQYWKNETWMYNAFLSKESKEYRALNHSACNEFRKRGISPGDNIYIVTVLSGNMYLGGRITVEKLLNREQAAKYLDVPTRVLWDAKDHIVMPIRDAGNFTPDNMIPREFVEKLRLGNDLKPLCFKEGKLDQQTLSGVRKLSPTSAKLLDSFL